MKHLTCVRGLLTGFLVAAIGALASAQTTWYVDLNGIPPGNGTAGAPYTSIQYAINQPTTLPGDTILVAPGTYVENLDDHFEQVRVVASGGPLVTELRPLTSTVATVTWTFFSTIEGFTLTGNTSSHINGGALNLGDGTAVRCIVRDNPGLGVYSAVGTLRECTIVDNGIGIHVEFFSTVVLRNTLVWSNNWNIAVGGMGIIVDYCAGAIPPGSGGVGNVIGDPGVWEIAGSRHRLRPGSPCIDAGDPSSPLDPDGTRADIGAIPYEPTFAPAPTGYCTAKLNSGCVPVIGAVGSASVTPGAPFTITAANEVDNKVGLLFFGFGERAQPFSGGVHCVALPTKRVGVQNSGGTGPCTGAYGFDMGAYIQSGIHPGLIPGALVYCQWWGRDPLDPAGFGTSLSDALSFGVAP